MGWLRRKKIDWSQVDLPRNLFEEADDYVPIELKIMDDIYRTLRHLDMGRRMSGRAESNVLILAMLLRLDRHGNEVFSEEIGLVAANQSVEALQNDLGLVRVDRDGTFRLTEKGHAWLDQHGESIPTPLERP